MNNKEEDKIIEASAEDQVLIEPEQSHNSQAQLLKQKVKMFADVKSKLTELQEWLKFTSQKLVPYKLTTEQFKTIYTDSTGETLRRSRNNRIKLNMDFSNQNKTKKFLSSMKNKTIPDLEELEILRAEEWEEELFNSFLYTNFPLKIEKLIIFGNVACCIGLPYMINILKLLDQIKIDVIEIIGYKISTIEINSILALSQRVKSINLHFCEFDENIELNTLNITNSKLEQIKIFSNFTMDYTKKSNGDLYSKILFRISEWSAVKESLKSITFDSCKNDYDAIYKVMESVSMENIILNLN